MCDFFCVISKYSLDKIQNYPNINISNIDEWLVKVTMNVAVLFFFYFEYIIKNSIDFELVHKALRVEIWAAMWFRVSTFVGFRITCIRWLINVWVKKNHFSSISTPVMRTTSQFFPLSEKKTHQIFVVFFYVQTENYFETIAPVIC